MQKKRIFTIPGRIFQLIALAIITVITIGSTFLPALTKSVSAASAPGQNATAIDLPTVDSLHAYSCQGFFTSAIANATLMQAAFSKVAGTTISQPSDMTNVPGLTSTEASYLENAWNKSETLPIITFREETGANNPVNGDINTAAGDECSYYTMVPTSGSFTNWVGLVGSNAVLDPNNGQTSSASSWSQITYSNISKSGSDSKGTFSWDFTYLGYCTIDNTGLHDTQKTVCHSTQAKNISKLTGSASNFLITGQPSSAQAGTSAINSMVIQWLNADEFTIASASGNAVGPDGTTINYSNYSGEIYRKIYWGGTDSAGLSFYFLQQSTAVDTNRTLWSSNDGCIDPMPAGAAPNDSTCTPVGGNGSSNCVPFFSITDDLDETDSADDGTNPVIDASNSSNNKNTNTSITGLQAAIDGLSASPMTYYDYTPYNSSCVASTPVTLKSGRITEQDTDNAKVWLYYSQSKNQFKTVFQDATQGSYESSFIGSYNQVQNGGSFYQGPIEGTGCSGQIGSPSPPSDALNTTYPEEFSLIDASTGCDSAGAIGHINVLAETVDDTTYDALTSITTHTTSTPPSKNSCDNSPQASMIDPILCGILDAVSGTAAGLDCYIGYYLKIDTNTIFNDTGAGGINSDNTQCSSSGGAVEPATTGIGDAYYVSWQAFRDIAYSILVIIFLIMIASEILDLEQFRAYNLRKMLPAAAIAIPLVAISWNAQDFIYNMANDSYDAIRSIIASPFSNIPVTVGGTTGNDITLALILPTLLIATGIGATVLSFMSLGGLAMLALSAFLAIFSAFVILIARTVVATFLIVTAPVAIICAIFKPFRKFYDIWLALTAALLLSIPAIGAELQISHDAAKIAFVDGHAATAIILLIAGYALLWSILKAMDKVAGKLGDVAAATSGRVSKMARKKAKDDFKYGLNRAVTGQDDPKGPMGGAKRLMAGAARRNMLSREGGWGSLVSSSKRDTYNAAVQKMKTQVADQMNKQDGGRSGGDDLMTELGMAGVSRADYVKRYQAGVRSGVREGIVATGTYTTISGGAATFASAYAALESEEARATTTTQRQDIARRRALINGLVDTQTEARSLKLAQESLAEAEVNFGAKMGTDTMRIAAAKARFASKTSYNEKGGWFDEHGKEFKSAEERKAHIAAGGQTYTLRGEQIEEDQIDFEHLQARMTRDISQLVVDGHLTINDAADIVKQRSDRVERSGVGTSLERSLITNAVERIKNPNINTNDIKKVLSASELDQAAKDVVEGPATSAILLGRHEAVRAMAPVIARQLKSAGSQAESATALWRTARVATQNARVELDVAVNAARGVATAAQQADIDAKRRALAQKERDETTTGTKAKQLQREFKRQLASMAALQDIARYAPPVNGRLFGQGVLGAGVNMGSLDVNGALGNGSVLQAIEHLRNNKDPDFELYRHEFDTQYGADAAGRDPSAAAGAIMGMP